MVGDGKSFLERNRNFNKRERKDFFPEDSNVNGECCDGGQPGIRAKGGGVL